MKRLALISLLILLFAITVQAQDDVSVESLPPVVVETYPKAGDTDVDPSIGEIRVTFSKDMMTDDMWSWVIHTKESFPTIAGDVSYLADGRTCVLPVSLVPDKTYAIWFNSPNYKHNAFRDLGNNPAVPYLLVFHTGN